MAYEKECHKCKVICPFKERVLGESEGVEDIYYLCESEICEEYPEVCEFLMRDFNYIPEFLN